MQKTQIRHCFFGNKLYLCGYKITIAEIMLVQFTFNNYKCFKDDTVMNLVASAAASNSHYARKSGNGLSLLKSLAVFGANASGKTKLFDALAFMQCVVCPPKRDGKVPIFDFWQMKYDAFRLNTYSADHESSFEIIFILDKVQYRYGFSLDKTQIVSEWLYVKKQRESLVFSREGADITIKGNQLSEKIFKNIESAGMLSRAIPLIAIMATFSDALCTKIVDWMSSIMVISANDLRPLQLLEPDKKSAIIKFMKAFDINIEDLSPHEVEYDQIPGKIQFLLSNRKADGKLYDGFHAMHKVYDEMYNRVDSTNFSLELDESFGTNRLLGMAWHIISSLRNGTLLLIDEFDSGIHPYIIKTIIELYYKSATDAQVVINSHNTSLLNAKDDSGMPLFKKDQIYVVNKNRYGESSLTPITDYSNDLRANLEKYYLNGDISGVPYVDTDALLNDIVNK